MTIEPAVNYTEVVIAPRAGRLGSQTIEHGATNATDPRAISLGYYESVIMPQQPQPAPPTETRGGIVRTSSTLPTFGATSSSRPLSGVEALSARASNAAADATYGYNNTSQGAPAEVTYAYNNSSRTSRDVSAAQQHRHMEPNPLYGYNSTKTPGVEASSTMYVNTDPEAMRAALGKGKTKAEYVNLPDDAPPAPTSTYEPVVLRSSSKQQLSAELYAVPPSARDASAAVDVRVAQIHGSDRDKVDLSAVAARGKVEAPVKRAVTSPV